MLREPGSEQPVPPKLCRWLLDGKTGTASWLPLPPVPGTGQWHKPREAEYLSRRSVRGSGRHL